MLGIGFVIGIGAGALFVVGEKAYKKLETLGEYHKFINDEYRKQAKEKALNLNPGQIINADLREVI